MLSNLIRGGKDTRIANSNLYWDPTAAKLRKVNILTNRNRVIYSLQRYNENTLRYIPNHGSSVITGNISIKSTLFTTDRERERDRERGGGKEGGRERGSYYNGENRDPFDSPQSRNCTSSSLALC